MKTFFALTVIPKEQLKGSKEKAYTAATPNTVDINRIEKPQYETEAAVTAAIANGTFKGNSAEAYKLAKQWQKQLKEESKPKFFAKKTAKVNTSRYMHRFGFCK